jgi:hypothetical protein
MFISLICFSSSVEMAMASRGFKLTLKSLFIPRLQLSRCARATDPMGSDSFDLLLFMIN